MISLPNPTASTEATGQPFYFRRREAQIMLLAATGGSIDDLTPEEQEDFEILLDDFKEYVLSL